MKATIILEGVSEELVNALQNNTALKDLGTKFKIIKMKKPKPSKRRRKGSA